MAEALSLDSGALNAIAQPRERKVLASPAVTVLRFAFERRALIRVPAPVLAEVCRATRFDSAINHLVNDGRNVAGHLATVRAQYKRHVREGQRLRWAPQALAMHL
jgi:hypothetical protein